MLKKKAVFQFVFLQKKKPQIKDDTRLLRCCLDVRSRGAERLLNLS